MISIGEMSPDVQAARCIAFVIAKAESNLGLTQTKIPIDDRLHAILAEAAMRPADVDPAVYALVYMFAQSEQQNVGHPDIKKQPAVPVHQPKSEQQKQ